MGYQTRGTRSQWIVRLPGGGESKGEHEQRKHPVSRPDCAHNI